MKVFHNTRESEYRTPFGALELGREATLSIDIFDDNNAECRCRVWIDGKGESVYPMERAGDRFTCTIRPDSNDILWYFFIITASDGSVWYYGAKRGHTGGEGELYSYEPPSFQITVYKKREVPEWYKNGIVYQIFPDRFSRGGDYLERAVESLGRKRNGPERALVDDWYSVPFYEKDENGRVTRWDFYGGTFSGIIEKLPYLKELGITIIYLNPVFEAASSHRYDTGDYMKTDPMLGTGEDFELLCSEASRFGISVILDGVFNHTGCDSRYFDKYGNYGGGAYGNEASPYRSWYRFDGSEIGYDCWWGVDDLPNVEENDPSYRDFICGNKDSVVRTWLRRGARGFRLDVADELPDDFIADIKNAVTEEREDGVLIGEVWEDASNKISYGKLRRYLLGDELDSAMNYPLRDAFIAFLMGSIDSDSVHERLMTLMENYPPESFYSAFNLIGGHDRPRILTVLGGAPDEHLLSEKERKDYKLPDWQFGLAKGRLWLMLLLQMTMPGVPCIYYGDEAGLQGFADPYNRAAFPWGKEDKDTGNIFRNAVAIRKAFKVFTNGTFEPVYSDGDVFCFFRKNADECAAVAVNRSLSQTGTLRLPASGKKAYDIVSGKHLTIETDGTVEVSVPPLGSAVIYFGSGKSLGRKMERGAGVLCHITSLPNKKGPGYIGAPAREFVDFLCKSGQRYWQILPVNPTDEYGSPYAGVSAFAGNIPLLGMSENELRKLYSDFSPDKEYDGFISDNADWLLPYAGFMAVRARYPDLMWQDWPEKYRTFTSDIPEELLSEAKFQMFCQFEFEKRWRDLKKYANDRGIMIIGDIPMYVSEDSADVWSHPELFMLEDGRKTMAAGVPPDYFSKDGQLWGNPVYDWDEMKKTGYAWWIRRLERAFSLYDYVRLDHFRGFESFWAVPEGMKATEGHWMNGPGDKLFRAAHEKFGELPIIAEDLGMITPAVHAFLSKCGFPGMDVMQFADSDVRYSYNVPEDKIAYTGTHDNQTIMGWCAKSFPDENPWALSLDMEERLFESRANVVIMPLQDVLLLDDDARMNTPGVAGENWKWQAEGGMITDDVSDRLLKLTTNSLRK